jgi:hypothetical protein
MAWGRIAELPEEITNALKSKAQGGSGAAAKFVEYCERETRKRDPAKLGHWLVVGERGYRRHPVK